MNQNKYFNTDNILSFEIFDKEPCKGFVFKKQNNSWFNYINEGFYLTDEYINLPSEPYSISDLENGNNIYKINFIVEDNKVFYKPHIKIEFQDNKFKYRYFNTIEECSEYIKEKFNLDTFKNL